MSFLPATRIDQVNYAIRNIVGKAKALENKGKKILYLNIGDPIKFDFQPPAHMIDAMSASMKEGISNGYAPSCGVSEAIEAVLETEIAKGKKDLKFDDVILTTGASEGIELAMTALLNPGEHIMLPTPGYPLYSALTAKIGIESVPYYFDEETWELDIASIRESITPKTRAIVIINPNNPTGKIYSKTAIEQLAALAEEHQLFIFSDEIYDGLSFDKEVVSISEFTNKVPVICFNGLAKSYLVPGWRVGWISCVNSHLYPEYVAALKKLTDARLCSPAPQQFAIKPALLGPQEHRFETIAKLKARRDICVNAINAIPGMKCTTPDGAFYLMPHYQLPTGWTDEEFVLKLLEETGVLFVHGSGFGMDPTKGTFRVVYLPQEEVLKEAMDKLTQFCNQI